MTAPAPARGSSGLPRGVLWAVVALVLLLVSSCTAIVLSQRTGDPSALGTPSPTPSSSGSASASVPAPAPTVTVLVTPPALPSTGPSDSTGGGSTGGGTSGSGSGSGNAQGPTTGSGTGTITGGTGTPFALTAVATGGPIMLGEKRTLRITITNPNARPLTVRAVTPRALAPSKSGCESAWLSVGGYDSARDPAVVVSARGSSVIDVSLELVDQPTTNQNACQGSTFPLSLSGSGQLS